MTKYVAKTDGFVDGLRVRAGQTFEWNGKRPGKWMEPADQVKPKVKGKQEPKEPRTLSEVQKELDADIKKTDGNPSNKEVI